MDGGITRRFGSMATGIRQRRRVHDRIRIVGIMCRGRLFGGSSLREVDQCIGDALIIILVNHSGRQAGSGTSRRWL